MAFDDTRWSLVLRAGSNSDESREALAALCQGYWPPLYSFLRMRGYSKDDASDVLQSFFLALIEKDFVSRARPEVGRFRTFLLTALTRFAANDYAKQTALKRGGGIGFVRLDGDSAEDLHQRIAYKSWTPEELYERQWAITILDQAMVVVETSYTQAGKGELFMALRPALASPADSTDYSGLSKKLGMTEGALRVAVHRLKARYRKALSAVIRETVHTADDEADELRHLIEVLGRSARTRP